MGRVLLRSWVNISHSAWRSSMRCLHVAKQKAEGFDSMASMACSMFASMAGQAERWKLNSSVYRVWLFVGAARKFGFLNVSKQWCEMDFIPATRFGPPIMVSFG